MMIAALVLDNLQLFSSLSVLNFINYLLSTTYFTYLFVSKLHKLTSNMVKAKAAGMNDDHGKMSKVNQKQENKLEHAMMIQIVQYTVLVIICDVSTIFIIIFQIIVYFVTDARSQLIVICVRSFLLQIDMFINYVSVIFQFSIYKKLYHRIFGCMDSRISKKFRVSIFGTQESKSCAGNIDHNTTNTLIINNRSDANDSTNTRTHNRSINFSGININDNKLIINKKSNLKTIALAATTASPTVSTDEDDKSA